MGLFSNDATNRSLNVQTTSPSKLSNPTSFNQELISTNTTIDEKSINISTPEAEEVDITGIVSNNGEDINDIANKAVNKVETAGLSSSGSKGVGDNRGNTGNVKTGNVSNTKKGSDISNDSTTTKTNAQTNSNKQNSSNQNISGNTKSNTGNKSNYNTNGSTNKTSSHNVNSGGTIKAASTSVRGNSAGAANSAATSKSGTSAASNSSIDVKGITKNVVAKAKSIGKKIGKILLNGTAKYELNTLRVEEVDLDKYKTEYTAEELDELKGTMTQEEYQEFLKGYTKYKQEEANYYKTLLKGDGKKEGFEQQLEKTDRFIGQVNKNGMVDSQGDAAVEKEFGYLGIHTYKELEEYNKELRGLVNNLRAGLQSANNMKKSAKYDNLDMTKGYSEYEVTEPTEEHKACLVSDSNVEKVNMKVMDLTSNGEVAGEGNVYSYTAYHEKHPEISEEAYMKMVLEVEGNNTFYVKGLDGKFEKIVNLAKISDVAPELERKYRYLYDQDPKKANEFLKDCEYEINNVKGQLEAKEFLDTLETKSADDDIWDAILNEFKVTKRALADGTFTAGEGIEYFFEALLTASGVQEENRTQTAREYKQMYIIQALSSNKAKEEAGLITLDPWGNYCNTGFSIIDYTKDYNGKFLANNYEISQSIGNMAPSLALSAFCPPAGSVFMGVSAGGNAYHGEMVAGQTLSRSIVYGAFSGTSEALLERFLGGLPGLSNTSVKGFRSFVRAMASEGREEALQEILDKLIFRKTILNEELPQTEEEWTKFAKDVGKAYVYGAITAGILQGPSFSINTRRLNSINNELKDLNISPEQVKEFTDGVRENEEYKDLSDDDILLGFGKEFVKELKDKMGIKDSPSIIKNVAGAAQMKLADNAGKISLFSNKNKDAVKFNNVLNTIAKNNPEYQKMVDNINLELKQSGNVITDSIISKYTELAERVLNSSDNIDVKLLLTQINELTDMNLFKQQSDGSYSYIPVQKSNFDVVKEMLQNKVYITDNYEKINNYLNQKMKESRKKILDAKLNDYYGTPEFMQEYAEYNEEAVNTLLESKYITEEERNIIGSYTDTLQNIRDNINSYDLNSPTTEESYRNIEANFKNLKAIEQKLAKINMNAWQRYFNQTGNAFIHCFTGDTVALSEFDSTKICTALSTKEKTNLEVFSSNGTGIIFNSDLSAIDSLAPHDAGSWDCTKDFFLNHYSKKGLQYISDSNITYEGGDHSILFSPDYIEAATNIDSDKYILSEIVFKNKNIQDYSYFVSDLAPPEDVKKIYEIATKEGKNVEYIDSKTNERRVITPEEIDKVLNPKYDSDINYENYRDTNCRFSLEQIMNPQYKVLCDKMFDAAPTEEARQVLEDILYRGKANGFNFASETDHKDNPGIEETRRASMAELYLKNPQTFKYICDNKIDLFHGTSAVALPSILNNGLTSLRESQKNSIDVKTGEEWSRSDKFIRGFVSFTDVLETSKYYSQISLKNEIDLSFPIIFGTTTEEVNKYNHFAISSDVSEVGVNGKLSVDSIKTIMVPGDKIDLVKNLVGSKNIKVLPMNFSSKQLFYDNFGPNVEEDAFSELKDIINNKNRNYYNISVDNKPVVENSNTINNPITYEQLNQIIKFMDQRHPEINNYGRDQVAAYLLTGDISFISSKCKNTIKTIPRNAILDYYQSKGLDSIFDSIKRRLPPGKKILPIENNNSDSIKLIDSSKATVIDVASLDMNQKMSLVKGNVNLNRSYEGYDYVVKPQTSLKEVLDGIKDIKQKVLIELNGVEELDPSLFENIPDNISFRISNYTNSHAQTDSILHVLDHLTYNAQELKIISSKLNEIKSGIDDNFTDYQKAEYVYNYLRDNIKYNPNPGGNVGRGKEYDGLASLIVGESTCEGFAHTYRMILNSLGIECEEVWGQLNHQGKHAFTIVKIGDETMLVDPVRELLNNTKGTGFGVNLDYVKNEYSSSPFQQLLNQVNSQKTKPLSDLDDYIAKLEQSKSIEDIESVDSNGYIDKWLENAKKEQRQFENEEQVITDNQDSLESTMNIILARAQEMAPNTNYDFKYLLNNISSILKKANINTEFTTKRKGQFNFKERKIYLNPKIVNNEDVSYTTFMHELGHALYEICLGKHKFTTKQVEILTKARGNYKLTEERKKILRESSKRITEAEKIIAEQYEQIRQQEEEKIKNFVQEFYDNNDIDGLMDYINELGIEEGDLDLSLSIEENIINTLNKNNQVMKEVEFRDLLSSADYLEDRLISGMLNSLLAENSILDLGDSEYEFWYAHPNEYYIFHKDFLSFHELVADYFLLKSINNQEITRKIETILGKDVIELLDRTYGDISYTVKKVLTSKGNTRFLTPEQSRNGVYYSPQFLKNMFNKNKTSSISSYELIDKFIETVNSSYSGKPYFGEVRLLAYALTEDTNYLNFDDANLTEIFKDNIANISVNTILDYYHSKGMDSLIEKTKNKLLADKKIRGENTINNLSSTTKDFISKFNFDVQSFMTDPNNNVKTTRDINPIISGYGVFDYVNENTTISAADLVGYDFNSQGKNILSVFEDYYDKTIPGKYDYKNRSIGFLDFQSGTQFVAFIKDLAEKKFDYMRINEIANDKYVISSNGLHRFAVLRFFYLLDRANKVRSEEELREMYKIPVNIEYKVNLKKSYCNYLITRYNKDYLEVLFDKNKIIINPDEIYSEEITEEQLLALAKQTIQTANKKQLSEIIHFYTTNNSFHEFIDRNIPEILDIMDKMEGGTVTNDKTNKVR